MRTVVYDYQTFCMQQFGGISRYFCELAERIERMPGLRARVVAPLHFNHHLHDSAVPTLGRHLALHPGGARPRSLFNRLASQILQRACKPDIVHRTYYLRQPRMPRTRYVVTVFDMIHELFPESFAANDPTSRLKRECVRAADHVMCISHSTARDLMRLFDMPAEKITVSHLGFSGVFSQVAHQSTVDASSARRPYLLYVGKRGGYKNFAAVLKAYTGSTRLMREFDLVCFGGEPFDAVELDGCGLREGALQHISGTDEALARAYTGAHAFVYPSLYEGFGIPPLEAMSCACPVACADTSSIPEVVGDAAEQFDPAQVDSVRTALERVCFDTQRRDELVSAGLTRIGLFSWDRCAAVTAETYGRLLAQ